MRCLFITFGQVARAGAAAIGDHKAAKAVRSIRTSNHCAQLRILKHPTAAVA
jgi:hypothetical protein